MKLFLFIIMFGGSAFTAIAQTSPANSVVKIPKSDIQVVEAACGECKFGMKGKGCQLAVRIDGKPYFVDGTSIDKHGDAHDAHGFCNEIRKAEVTGSIVNDRFAASSFKLLPVENK